MMAAGAVAPSIDLPAGEFFVKSHAWADGSMLHKSGGTLYRSMHSISGGALVSWASLTPLALSRDTR